MDADFLKMLQPTMIQLPDRVDDHKGEKVINEMGLQRTLPQRNPFSERGAEQDAGVSKRAKQLKSESSPVRPRRCNVVHMSRRFMGALA